MTERDVSIEAQTVEAELHAMALQDIVTRCRNGKIKRSDPDIARYSARLEVATAIVETLHFVRCRLRAQEAGTT